MFHRGDLVSFKAGFFKKSQRYAVVLEAVDQTAAEVIENPDDLVYLKDFHSGKTRFMPGSLLTLEAEGRRWDSQEFLAAEE